mmetsp:Transcript_61819/g.121421  ORF Transcript_61819/g.121421 Transcript_61819/m.121421 type:complete len:136 (+) Transcript_61819:42-449(+)
MRGPPKERTPPEIAPAQRKTPGEYKTLIKSERDNGSAASKSSLLSPVSTTRIKKPPPKSKDDEEEPPKKQRIDDEGGVDPRIKLMSLVKEAHHRAGFESNQRLATFHAHFIYRDKELLRTTLEAGEVTQFPPERS